MKKPALIAESSQSGASPWCCPKPAGFWRPGCASWRAALVVSSFFILTCSFPNGAAAGNRTRTFSLARRHSAVKSQPRKKVDC